MYLIFKIKNYVPGFYRLENLDFKMKVEDLTNVFYTPAKVKYDELKRNGHCYVYRQIEMTDINQVEYLIIDEDFNFNDQLKKRHDILSILRERKINEIIS